MKATFSPYDKKCAEDCVHIITPYKYRRLLSPSRVILDLGSVPFGMMIFSVIAQSLVSANVKVYMVSFFFVCPSSCYKLLRQSY